MNPTNKLFTLIAPVILICSCSGSSSNLTPTSVDGGAVQNSVIVDRCDRKRFSLSSQAKEALIAVGFTKCAMPFGVLVAADQEIPDNYILTVAKIVAEMIDPDMDGKANDPSIIPHVKKWDVGWLAMPVNQNRWDSEQLPQLVGILGYDIIVPKWWFGDSSAEYPDSHAKQVMVEEITHFLTEFAYSKVYPEALGVTNWNSIIAKETMRAQCNWWQHPENDCPGSPAEGPGDCSDPGCDVTEFYHQVLILRAGMEPGWLGIGFPRSKEVLEEKLSEEMKAMMDDPRYHQIKSPLSFNYPSTE